MILRPVTWFKPLSAVTTILTLISLAFPWWDDNFWMNALMQVMVVPCIFSILVVVIIFAVWSLTPSKWWKWD